MTLTRLITFVLATFAAAHALAAASPTTRPNIVYILADDLGYGDVRCYNPQRGKIPTPNIDALAQQGIRFTDAHSSSSVCTPTRYNILTGRYAWRTRLQRGVLQGDSPPLIARDCLTVAELLRDSGYTTAAIGKWHLGMASIDEQRWSDPIADGPLQHGFHQFFGISASLDMPPFAYIAGNRFPELPTTRKTWLRTGPAAATFDAVDVLPDLVKKSTEFIARHAPPDPHVGAKRSEVRAQRRPGSRTPEELRNPFFLYLALTAPHTPIVPAKPYVGKSNLTPYADFVMQTDDAVGAILTALRDANLEHDTLVILTSDNGPSPAAGIKALEAQGHFPSGNFRGHKADIWEGGHRVPFIVRWPAVVTNPGRTDDRLICLGDLIATCAEILGATLPDNAGEDSVSFLSTLRTDADAHAHADANPRDADAKPRDALIHHSINGNFAIRQGKWKLALCAGSGGWSAPREPQAAKQNLPRTQLYDLSRDPAETTNLAADRPDVVERLQALFQRYVDQGRSTPGPPQKNDVSVDVMKKPAAKD